MCRPLLMSLLSRPLRQAGSAGSGLMSLWAWWCWYFLALYALRAAARQCPPCGNQTVPYPLSTSRNCGHPRYQLSCTPRLSQLRLQAISGSYAVRDITPASKVFTLDPAPLLSRGASCISQDLTRGGLVLNRSQPFTISSANTLILLNCTQFLLRSPLTCGNASPCNQAITASGDTSCRSLLCCSIENPGSFNSFNIPLNESACSAYTSVTNMGESVTGQDWKFGVQVGWDTPTEPPCINQTECPSNSVCRDSTTAVSTCHCNSGYVWHPDDGLCMEGLGLRHRTALIAGLTASLLVLLVFLAFIFTAIYRKWDAKRQARKLVSLERSRILNSNGAQATLFSARDMKLASGNFNRDHLLGSGGFGEVYKGVLRDGTIVAIKVAKLGNVKGCDQVLNEVRILSQVNHRNLVRLLGCCIETEQPLMVYEYVANGNLFEHLGASLGFKKQSSLPWDRRLRIAKETAEGLTYLHAFANPPIIHRDVKSSNILLDGNLTAKVSDFGLSRLVEDDVTHISTCAQGTLGYLDPHYYRNYHLSDKSDVYSFGVVLLELVTSQRAIDFTRSANDVNLAVYVGDRYEQGTVDEVLDPVLVKVASESEIVSMRDVITLAIACLQEDGGNRPRMTEVVKQITSILQGLGLESLSTHNSLKKN